MAGTFLPPALLAAGGFASKICRQPGDGALKDTPLVMVIGPRQCGKATLVRNLVLGERNYLMVTIVVTPWRTTPSFSSCDIAESRPQ